MKAKKAITATQMMTVLIPRLTCIFDRLRISTMGIATVMTMSDIAPPVSEIAVASPPVRP